MYVAGRFPGLGADGTFCSRGLIGRCLRARMQVLDTYSGQEPARGPQKRRDWSRRVRSAGSRVQRRSSEIELRGRRDGDPAWDGHEHRARMRVGSPIAPIGSLTHMPSDAGPSDPKQTTSAAALEYT